MLKKLGIRPNQMGPNFQVDQTKAVQYLKEIRDSIVPLSSTRK